MKIDFYSEPQILPMEISEMCVSTDRIYPYMTVSGSCDNTNLHSLVDLIWPPFGSPTVIGGVLNVFLFMGFA